MTWAASPASPPPTEASPRSGSPVSGTSWSGGRVMPVTTVTLTGKRWPRENDMLLLPEDLEAMNQ